MKHHSTRSTGQRGAMLIEALIAILIFSVGVLGIIGMQASAVQASTDSSFRSEAAMLANELIGQMWASNRTQATLQAAYSTGGDAYTQWVFAGGVTAAPGTSASPAAGTVYFTLPGARTNPPTVVIAPSAGTAVPTSLVTITIFWQVPGGAVRNYTTMAQVGG